MWFFKDEEGVINFIFFERLILVFLDNISQDFVFFLWGLQLGLELIFEFFLFFSVLEYKFYSGVCFYQCLRFFNFLFFYLSIVVVFVVDCREREIEVFGIVQSQEVVEILQKGWEGGEERSGKVVEEGIQFLVNSCCFLGFFCGKQRQF